MELVANLTRDHIQVIKTVLRYGDDRWIRTKKWDPYKTDLLHWGYLTRRIGNWALVPTTKAKRDFGND